MDETLPPQRPLPATGFDTGDDSPDSETRELKPLPQSGSHVGPYPIETKIGEGGMGKVYCCQDPALERRVAVKVLHDKYGKDERYRERFRREARTIARLTHPHVAQIYGIGSADDSSLFITMEYVSGESVERMLEATNRILPEQAIRIVSQTAQALQFAARQGIIHRDIKPSNILVDATGSVKIVDFGLAKILESGSSLTDEGVVLGTPHYISPEQGRGRTVDQRSDIYSLGATFYHMVAGRPPFEGSSQIEVIVKHVQDDPVAPHLVCEELPVAVSEVIGRMMARSPDDRYQTYDDLLEDLDRLAAGALPRRRERKTTSRFSVRETTSKPSTRALWAAACLALVLLLGAAVLAWPSTDLSDRLKTDLQGWYIPRADGAHTLHFDFATPPAGIASVLGRIFVIPPATARGVQVPSLVEGTLSWENYRGAFACAYVFKRIDEVRVTVANQQELCDLGLAFVDPSTSKRRELVVRLRPREGNLAPVEAQAVGDPLTLDPPLPSLPRLVTPYTVVVRFLPASDGTSDGINLELEIESGPRQRTVYRHRSRLVGSDWATGSLVFRSGSPTGAFRVGLAKVVLSGELSGETLREVPWHG